jgi:hypothetical protein
LLLLLCPAALLLHLLGAQFHAMSNLGGLRKQVQNGSGLQCTKERKREWHVSGFDHCTNCHAVNLSIMHAMTCAALGARRQRNDATLHASANTAYLTSPCPDEDLPAPSQQQKDR